MSGAVLRRRFRLRIEGLRAEAAFAIIADVERYPEFLPAARSARIVRREPQRLWVDNAFGVGPLQSRFRSEARLDPPRALTIRSDDGPWRNLEVAWRLEERDGACVIECEAVMGFRSAALAALMRVTAGEAESWVARAFERRLRAAAR